MKTAHEKEAVATPHVSAIISNHGISIDQAVHQAIADTSKPSAEQSAIQSSLPGAPINKELSELVGRFHDNSSSDPTSGGSAPTGATNTAMDALRSQAEKMFDPAGHDPTQKGDLHSDWIHSGATLADLRAALAADGVNISTSSSGTGGIATDDSSKGGTGNVTDPSGGSAISGDRGLKHPDGPPPDGGGSGHDRGHNQLEGMLSAGGKTELIDDYKDKSKDGHEIHEMLEVYKDGTVIDFLQDKTTGEQLLEQISPDGSKTVTITDKNGGFMYVETDKNHNVTKTITDDGKGHRTVSIPDGEHEGATLPPELQKEMHQMLVDASKSLHQPTHENDNVDARDDVPGAVSVSHTGPLGDHKATLLGGDRSNLEGVQNDGGGLSTQPNYNNSMNGARDPGIDDVSVQTNGREERDTTHHINTDPTRSQNAGGNGSGGQHTDGQQNGGNNGSPGTPVETAVQKAAEKLQHVDNTHSPDAAHPLNVHEKSPVEVEHGGIHAQAGNDFADLIRLAQNPAQFGALNAGPANAGGTGAALHLPLPADLAGPGGLHEIDHVQPPVTAHVEPVQHDHAFDLHGVTAVFDHSHFGH